MVGGHRLICGHRKFHGPPVSHGRSMHYGGFEQIPLASIHHMRTIARRKLPILLHVSQSHWLSLGPQECHLPMSRDLNRNPPAVLLLVSKFIPLFVS